MRQTVLRKAGIVLFWLFLWHLLALWVDNPILMVTPFRAILALAGAMGTLSFWQTVGCSLFRIGAGFLMGVLAAFTMAALAFCFPLIEEILSPVITLMKAIPVASFVVLLLIWWGSAFLAVAICFLIVLPNIYISTLEGLKSADKRLVEMARVFRMPFKNCFFYIYRPALKPFLLSSLKLALGMCWKSGVAAEVIGTPAFSVGERLYLSKIYLDTAGVFAWTTVVILLSLCFEKVVLGLARAFFAWEPACIAPARTKVSRGIATEEKESYEMKNAGGDTKKEAENTALECRKLSKSYGSLRVIREMDADYEAGQTYYLTSPSGSGKTTLLRLLCGLERPDGGTVEPKLRFSYVFQEDRLCEAYSAVRNVEMVLGRNRGGKPAATGEEARGRENGSGRRQTVDGECGINALRELLPEEALHKPCSQLSGGMKRRVALVRAMEAESDCVLLDEPFTGMDAQTKEMAESYIRSRQRGRILIIATHI